MPDPRKGKKYLSDCDVCPLFGRMRIRGEGDWSSPICFVGQNPGSKEAEAGRPFANPDGAGGRFNRMLEQIGITRDDIWLTNAVKCVLPAGREVPEAAVRHCWPELAREAEGRKLVVGMGLVAESILREKLTGQDLFRNPVDLFFTIHPAAACRRSNFEARLVEETDKLREVIESGEYLEETQGGTR